jgi:hypothetical protein
MSTLRWTSECAILTIAWSVPENHAICRLSEIAVPVDAGLGEDHMEELDALRILVQNGDYEAALALIDELDAMSLDDKLTKIESYMQILLLHCIKQMVEQRTTRSWGLSIAEAARRIAKVNKRRKACGWYLSTEELQNALAHEYEAALRRATLEVHAGLHTSVQLALLVDCNAVLATAWEHIAVAMQQE